jgi:hypothetical protein
MILTFSIGAIPVFAQKSSDRTARPNNFGSVHKIRDYKVLGSGSYSKVETPFVFVARDEETYRLLGNLVDGLPAAATIDFSKNAVVAGFAGTRPTGGWSVEIRKAGKRTVVELNGPRKDMMVTQVITTPYKVVLVPLEDFRPLDLDFTPSYAKNLKTFNTDRGDFEFSGGIAGRRTAFAAAGTVQVLTYEEYATVIFDLKAKNGAAKRRLAEIASGTLKNGRISISRLDPGSFVDLPRPVFGVSGTIKDKVLALNFNSRPTPYADGFVGTGSVSATAVK